MNGGFASRFVAELGFLIVLAVALGFADVRPAVIALFMAGGWVIVTLIEWLAWRSERRVAAGLGLLSSEGEPQLEEEHGWDAAEILAPLPEDEYEQEPEQDDALTSVLPPDELSDPEAGGQRT
jgi:hypothetical protein